MKYTLRDIQNNNNYSKYFIYNESNFILFQCDLKYDFV